MKKIYTIAALALAVSVSASASDIKLSKGMSIANATLQTEIQGYKGSVGNSPMQMVRTAPAKKIESGKDLVGTYLWSYYGNLTSSSGPGNSVVMLLQGDNDNQIVFSGFPYTDIQFVGTFDAAAQTITIKKQNTGVQGGDGKGNTYDIWFVPGNISGSEWKGTSQIVGRVTGNGHIEFGEWREGQDEEGNPVRSTSDTFTLTTKDPGVGYWWMSQNNILDYKPEFKYNASEWADLGTGKYLDAYFEPLLENAAPEYDVQIKYNINQKSLMMVYNPYPMDIWQGFNAGNGDGYLVFDISRRDCVRVKTLVASDMWTENQDGSLTNYYLFNEEGYRYDILGQSVDEIMEEYESIFADVSNVNGNDVFLENIVFGISGNPAGLHNWVDGNNEPIPFNTGLITLPNGWETGVEGIVVDDNAPVKYYNLQGMEVLNPEAGSIVIEKKGNKAVKRIVK